MKWETIRLIGEAKCFPYIFRRSTMKFKEFKIVQVDLNYLQALHDVDSEVMYRRSADYAKKPFLGILVTNHDRKYVIPLTSAKEKHKSWADVHQSYYRIYEIIDMRTAVYDDKDIIVKVTNTAALAKKGVPAEDFDYYKKRILSILEIKKMIPVIDGVFSYVDLELTSDIPKDEHDWRVLTYKEYAFCKNVQDGIRQKATKIYEKQIKTGKVLKFHCDYKKLESVADSYRI